MSYLDELKHVAGIAITDLGVLAIANAKEFPEASKELARIACNLSRVVDRRNAYEQATESVVASELVPCPFCGDDRISESKVVTERSCGMRLAQTQCNGCLALGPALVMEGGKCGDAVGAWNSRAQAAQGREVGEGLRLLRELLMFLQTEGYDNPLMWSTSDYLATPTINSGEIDRKLVGDATSDSAADSVGAETIADTLQSWLDFQMNEFGREGRFFSDETHVRSVPVYPTRGTVRNWIDLLRRLSRREG